MISKIINLKEIYELISENCKKSVVLSQQIDFIYNQFDSLYIDYSITETLFDKKLLYATLNDLINEMIDVDVEIEFPSVNFKEIFSIVLNIIKQVQNNMNGNANQYISEEQISKSAKIRKRMVDKLKASGKEVKPTSIKIKLFISKIDSTDQSLNNNNLIQYLKIGSNVDKIEKQAFTTGAILLMLNFHHQLQ